MTAPSQPPPEGEYAPYYGEYIRALPAGDVVGLMQLQGEAFARLPAALLPGQETHAYAPGKWTVREVIAHLCHTERVFGYRAFRFAHGDLTPLPGFDETAYVAGSTAASRTLAHLVDELLHLRKANLCFFSSLEAPQWLRVGTANAYPASVRALAFVIVGHAAHHLHLLRDRYGLNVPADPA